MVRHGVSFRTYQFGVVPGLIWSGRAWLGAVRYGMAGHGEVWVPYSCGTK